MARMALTKADNAVVVDVRPYVNTSDPDLNPRAVIGALGRVAGLAASAVLEAALAAANTLTRLAT